MAVLCHFACHPIMNPPSKGNSADYPGFASKVIEDALGGGALAFFVQGCGGDINPVRYKVTAFVTGAFFAGIAGGLYAHHKQFLSPTGFDFLKSIDIVVMVILGGMGRTAGVIIAAVILTLLPEVLRSFADYRMIIYSLLIIALMMARPQGLFTLGQKKKGAAAI